MYLFKDNFLVSPLVEILFSRSKSNDFLKFLKKIVIIKPMQNSKPARANKKKEVEVRINSSLIVPTTVV